MARCAGCGEDNPAQARFCLACGTPFGTSVPSPVSSIMREVRKVVTVVFCDLTGSTELGEKLDLEALRALLDRYFSTMSEVVTRHGGSVEKFIGDAVMAVFGVPVLHENDALRAVRAASEMATAMRRLQVELDGVWGVHPDVRIGVSTGEVIAGDSAGHGRLATGDAVNVAARLEQAAGAGQVVLSNDTYRLVRDAVDVEALAPLLLKGKSEPMPAYLVRSVSDRPEGIARRLDGPLVGRERELAALRTSYDAAVSDGARRRVMLVGPAGIGKSRLLAEFLSSLGHRATVLRGQCLPYGRGITFWPVRQMLLDAATCSAEDLSSTVVRRIADLMPGERDREVVAQRLADLTGLSGAPGRIEEGYWAVARLVESLSRWRPVVLVVDDVHWAEDALLELLDRLAPGPGPVLVLACARPELLDVHPDLGADGVRVALQPLLGDASDRLIEAVLGSTDVAESVRDHVRAVAEGNPLFVEQLLAALQEDGVVVHSSAGWVVNTLLERSTPPSIQALLHARLERLTGAEQTDLKAAAVIGRVFWRSAVAELAGDVVGPESGEHLLALVGRDLISPDSSEFAGDEAYRFQHILVRDAAYAALPKAARAVAHERFAEWLQRAAGERIGEYDEILGYHLEQAFELRSRLAAVDERARGVARAAGAHLTKAGRRAFSRGDVSAAVNLLERAQALLLTDPRARLSLVPTLAEALAWRGHKAAALKLLQESLVEGRALRDRRLTTHITLARAALRDSDDSTKVQERVARDAATVFTEEQDDEGLARAWMLAGLACTSEGRTAEAEKAWAAAVGPALRAAPELAEEAQMWLASYSVYGPTPFPEVSDRLEAMSVRVAGKAYREGSLLRGRAFVAAARGDFDAAYVLLGRARETFAALGLHYVRALVSQTTFEVALRQSDLVAALPELQADDQALADIGERWGRSTTTAMLAHSMVSAERFSDALTTAHVARELTSVGDVLSQVLWRTAAARALCGDGRAHEALRLVAQAVALVARTDWLCVHADALLVQAEVEGVAGRSSRVLPLIERAIGLYTAKGDLASTARAEAARSRHLRALG